MLEDCWSSIVAGNLVLAAHPREWHSFLKLVIMLALAFLTPSPLVPHRHASKWSLSRSPLSLDAGAVDVA